MYKICGPVCLYFLDSSAQEASTSYLRFAKRLSVVTLVVAKCLEIDSPNCNKARCIIKDMVEYFLIVCNHDVHIYNRQDGINTQVLYTRTA